MAADTTPTGRSDGDLGTTWNLVIPADRVQPTAEGGTPTYIDYRITLKNVSQTSTRYVAFTLATSPDANFVEFTASTAGPTVPLPRMVPAVKARVLVMCSISWKNEKCMSPASGSPSF